MSRRENWTTGIGLLLWICFAIVVSAVASVMSWI